MDTSDTTQSPECAGSAAGVKAEGLGVTDLRLLLARVFAEARNVEAGANSPELLLKLMRATHNVPSILSQVCEHNQSVSGWGEELSVSEWARLHLLPALVEDPATRSWLQDQLPEVNNYL